MDRGMACPSMMVYCLHSPPWRRSRLPEPQSSQAAITQSFLSPCSTYYHVMAVNRRAHEHRVCSMSLNTASLTLRRQVCRCGKILSLLVQVSQQLFPSQLAAFQIVTPYLSCAECLLSQYVSRSGYSNVAQCCADPCKRFIVLHTLTRYGVTSSDRLPCLLHVNW
jgi:hypothetical protein